MHTAKRNYEEWKWEEEHKMLVELHHWDHCKLHLEHQLNTSIHRIEHLEAGINTLEANQARGVSEAASFGSYVENQSFYVPQFLLQGLGPSIPIKEDPPSPPIYK